jgi:hypothetical protein
MNEMMERVMGTLRSAFQSERRVEVGCWMRGCNNPPAMVLAGTENGVLAGCREHARKWVTSDACRVAAESGGYHTVDALERWADEHGAHSPPVESRPRNDVLLFQHAQHP